MHQSSHRRASLSAEDPEPLALIAATLRGEPSPYPADVSTEFAETLLDTCAAHGVGPLLRHFLAELGIGKSWPAVIQDRLRESALATVANERRRAEAVLTDALRHIAGAPGAELADHDIEYY